MADEQITNPSQSGSDPLLNGTNGTPAGQQTQTTDFMAGLDASFRDNPSIAKFGGDVNKLAKSYLSLESLMGQGRVVIPKDEADREAWTAYDKAFGVPEKEDGYQLTAPQGVELAEFKKIMRENHISPSVAQKLLDAHLGEFERVDAQIKQQRETARQNAEAELKKEWGLKYAENMQTANSTLKKLSGSEADYQYFVDLIGNDTKFIRLLNNIGSKLSEGSLGGLEGQASGFTRTPSEAQKELERIISDPNDAYWAGSRNRRDNPEWCRAHNASFVSEEERKQRVDYVKSLIKMAG